MKGEGREGSCGSGGGCLGQGTAGLWPGAHPRGVGFDSLPCLPGEQKCGGRQASPSPERLSPGRSSDSGSTENEQHLPDGNAVSTEQCPCPEHAFLHRCPSCPALALLSHEARIGPLPRSFTASACCGTWPVGTVGRVAVRAAVRSPGADPQRWVGPRLPVPFPQRKAGPGRLVHTEAFVFFL